MLDRTIPVKFFKGLEVEATNHFLHPTLLGVHQFDVPQIVAHLKEHGLDHFLLCIKGLDDTLDLHMVFDVVQQVMDQGFRVTIEMYTPQLTDKFVEFVPDNELFAILLCAYVPNIAKLAKLTTLKLDNPIGGENGGVWCARLDTIQEKSVFTPWAAYDLDEFIE